MKLDLPDTIAAPSGLTATHSTQEAWPDSAARSSFPSLSYTCKCLSSLACSQPLPFVSGKWEYLTLVASKGYSRTLPCQLRHKERCSQAQREQRLLCCFPLQRPLLFFFLMPNLVDVRTPRPRPLCKMYSMSWPSNGSKIVNAFAAAATH